MGCLDTRIENGAVSGVYKLYPGWDMLSGKLLS